MKLLVIVLTAPEENRMKTALGLSEAALERGHTVTVFLTGNGTLNASQSSAETFSSTVKRLIEKGMIWLACRESLRQRGLASEGSLIPGVRVSSLAEMVETMESSDKTLIFG